MDTEATSGRRKEEVMILEPAWYEQLHGQLHRSYTISTECGMRNAQSALGLTIIPFTSFFVLYLLIRSSFHLAVYCLGV